MDISSFLTSLSIGSLGFNWIDVLIFIVVFFYAAEGYALGFLVSFIDFLSFALSFTCGIIFYSFIAGFLVKYFSIPQGFSNALGFFVVAVFFEIVFNFILKSFVKATFNARKDGLNNEDIKKINKILGIIPGFLSGLLLVAFVLSLIISLPFSVFLKHSVSNSKTGAMFVAATQGFSKDWNDIFGKAVNDSFSFLTVEPKSNESVALNFKTDTVSIDYQSEQTMLQLVNQERVSQGLSSLSFSESLTKLGRDHCVDMFKRGYFSHYTPEGASPFDRMVQNDINFNYAGENLALASSVDLAMKGFMQSPGHKANILSVNFHRVGIGVIDGGIYGEMFCQEFTD